MTFRDKKIGTTVLGGLLVIFGIAQAESASGSSLSGAPPLAQGEPGSSEGSADTRSLETILAEAQATLDRMEAAADNISRQLRQAREEKDVVKTICLDDKLSQMNVAARSASDRVAGIKAAADIGNMDRAQQDDAVLGALDVRANELIAEANQCIGEETGTFGKTKLELKVDPAIPTTDTAAPRLPPSVSTPPVAASPTS